MAHSLIASWTFSGLNRQPRRLRRAGTRPASASSCNHVAGMPRACAVAVNDFESERPDLNRQSPAPKAGALPSCATLCCFAVETCENDLYDAANIVPMSELNQPRPPRRGTFFGLRCSLQKLPDLLLPHPRPDRRRRTPCQHPRPDLGGAPADHLAQLEAWRGQLALGPHRLSGAAGDAHHGGQPVQVDSLGGDNRGAGRGQVVIWSITYHAGQYAGMPRFFVKGRIRRMKKVGKTDLECASIGTPLEYSKAGFRPS